MDSPAPQLSRSHLGFPKTLATFGAILQKRVLPCSKKSRWSNAHIWGANIQEEEQTFPTLQPLPSCPQNWPSYGCSTLTYLCTVIKLSLVLNNDIKRKLFSCRFQPPSNIDTTVDDLLQRYSLLNVTVFAPCKKYFASYPSSKKWPFCPHPCCQLSPKKLESGHYWVVYIPLLTMENAIS